MSDENVPKLRLKPKLVGEAVVASAPAAAVTPEPAVVEPAGDAPKLVRLRPKLAVAPAAEDVTPAAEPAAAQSAAPEPSTPELAAPEPPARPKPRLSNPPMARPMSAPPIATPSPLPSAAEATAPVAEPAKSGFRLGLKPKAAEPAPTPPPPEAASVPPPVADVVPPDPALEAPAPVLAAPPPPPPAVENGEPAEITAMRRITGAPFPPPGKFPPPPALPAGTEAGAKAKKSKSGKPGSKKKLILMAGGGVLALALLGAGFVGYQKLTAPPPEPARKPRPVAKPATAAPVVPAPAPAAASATPPAASAATLTPAETKPATVVAKPEPVVTPAEPAKPMTPPPPPAPSAAFRAWVENLQVRGVRGGATPRIFIGSSSYQKGDLVNPQLGITFDSYDDTTRVLTFKDKAGARVERRH